MVENYASFLISTEINVECIKCGTSWKTRVLLSLEADGQLKMTYPKEMNHFEDETDISHGTVHRFVKTPSGWRLTCKINI